MLVRIRDKGKLMHCCRECKLGWPLLESVWRFLKKPKIDLSYDPGHISEGM
jgi:hypothetical protein